MKLVTPNYLERRVLENFLVRNSTIRFFAWASLVSQIALVITGGAVRLTGSGLGCPTWPECQPGSITNVPELGMHGVIEFANRLLTFVLLLIAILTFLVVMARSRENRKGFFWTSFSLGLGIIAQAVIGGISVLTGLNSWVVGSHFIVSGILIAIATILLWYSYGSKQVSVDRLAAVVTRLLYPIGVLTVVIGVIVTGAGPHAGDAKTPRNGLNIELMAHFHSYPAYLTVALVVIQLYLLQKSKVSLTSSIWLLIVLISQASIGIAQTKLGLPILLVGLHMAGAAILISLLTWQMLSRGIWFRRK